MHYSEILNKGEVTISSEKWNELNTLYTKDQVKQLISDAVGSGIGLPYRKITCKDAEEDFRRLLSFDTNSLLKPDEWFTRYDYDHLQPLDVITTSNVGNKASDFFHQESRWLCDSINAPSPYRTWNTEKFRLTLLNALWTLKVKEVNSTTLRTCIGLRKYIASQFRPSAAKLIYNYFGAENVLDTSSGWGDRFCGFSASKAKSYHVIDPNNNVQEGYLKQKNFYEEILGNSIDADFYEGGSEFIESYQGKKFDFMFTSPPYFNIERYTQEGNQSFKMYRKFDKWMELFLKQTLKNTWDCLEDQGTMVINISDVYSNHTINRICDEMVDFALTLPDCTYRGTLGYEMRKRPNSGALKGKEGVFCEPVWVFKKHRKIY